ncbi:MAG: sulfur carrier protein ThiS [Candidatus Delongbacteria bacterium]|nr:sulfur carrier protein ThiS [Candidatus Delongbacteria bacterium]
MKIVVNGKEESTGSKTILDFILDKELEPKTIIIEYNLKIVKKDSWDSIELQDGDNLEILNFVGGG